MPSITLGGDLTNTEESSDYVLGSRRQKPPLIRWNALPIGSQHPNDATKQEANNSENISSALASPQILFNRSHQEDAVLDDTNSSYLPTEYNGSRPDSTSSDDTTLVSPPVVYNGTHRPSKDITEYEMSYEQLLEKGVQLWKSVKKEHHYLGCVDRKKMAALTIVM